MSAQEARKYRAEQERLRAMPIPDEWNHNFAMEEEPKDHTDEENEEEDVTAEDEQVGKGRCECLL